MENINKRTTGLKKVTTQVNNRFLDSSNVNAVIKPVYEYLSDKCFQVEGKQQYRYVLRSTGDVIKTSSVSELKRRMKIEYCGQLVDGYPISTEVIDSYIDTVLMTVDGEMALPLCGAVASVNNRYYINKFVDNAIDNNDPLLDSDILMLDDYLTLMARGNFNITEYDMTCEKLIDIVIGKKFERGSKEELVDFFFNWISGIYHRPGVSYPTVPCFFGRKHGTGKGTMASVITRIVGNSLANVSQSATAGRFNSLTDGKLILVYNEVAEYKDFYNDIIKGTNSEETRIVEAKGVDSLEVINITNMILFSNNLTPFKIDQGDRRLVVIQTLSNDSYDMASAFYEFHKKYGHDVIDQLAYSLVKIIKQVNFQSCANLHHAIKTDAKGLMEESYRSPVERFFEDTDVEFIDINQSKARAKRTSIKKLENLFSDWIRQASSEGLLNVSEKYSKTKDSFRNDLKKLSKENLYIETNQNGEYFFTDSFYQRYCEAKQVIDVEEGTSEKVSQLEAARARLKKMGM